MLRSIAGTSYSSAGSPKSCLPNYTSFVEKFLSDRFAESELMSGKSLLSRCDIIHSLAGITVVTRTRQAPCHCAALLPTLSSASRRHQGRPGRPIPSVATWSLATTPKSLPAGTVRRVLEQQNRTTPLGRRNYAIMLLLARLGLRAGEVVRLNLEDIGWENGVIRIRQEREPLDAASATKRRR